MYFIVSLFLDTYLPRRSYSPLLFKDPSEIFPCPCQFLVNFLLVKEEYHKELMSCFTLSPTEGWKIHKPSQKIEPSESQQELDGTHKLRALTKVWALHFTLLPSTFLPTLCIPLAGPSRRPDGRRVTDVAW